MQRYALLEPYASERLLMDRSPLSLLRSNNGLNPDLFTPQVQRPAGLTDWEEYYRLFYYAHYQPSLAAWLRPEALEDYADSMRYQGQMHVPVVQRVPNMDLQLRIMNLTYREVADSAVEKGYLRYDSLTDRLSLALGPWRMRDTLWFPLGSQPPHVIMDTVVLMDSAQVRAGWSRTLRFVQAVADRSVLYGLRANQWLKLVVPNGFWVSNDSLSYLMLDVDDGRGWRRVFPGQLLTWQYQQFGAKTLRLKWISPGGQNLGDAVTTIPLQWAEMRWGNPDRVLASGVPSCSGIRPQVSGVTTAGKAYAYLKRARTTPFGVLNPLILVEGFEGGVWVKGSNEEVPGNHEGFGELTWATLSSGVFPERYRQLADLPSLLDSFQREGFDLVFVDYQTNHASVQKNAYALISLLEQIKRLADSTRHAIGLPDLGGRLHVLGASMGGLIARVALRQMELGGCCHDVASFGTLSTPHKGAHIPLSAQHALVDGVLRANFMGRMERRRQQLHYVLRSPAAAQMLVYHYDTVLQEQHEALMVFLDSLGLPRETRNYALTNGSLFGTRQGRHAHSPRDSILDGEMAFAMDAGVWAPCTFPVPFRSFRTMGSQRMYLFRNKGQVMVHSPHQAAGDTVYMAGSDIHRNFQQIQQQYTQYLKGLGCLAVNNLVHAVAMAAWPPWIPWFILSRQSVSLIISNRFRSILENQWAVHLRDNRLGTYSVCNRVPREGLDYMPGDYSSMGVVQSDPFVQSLEPVSLHSFVGSASALNLAAPAFVSIFNHQYPFEGHKHFMRWMSRPALMEQDLNDPHVAVYKQWAATVRDWMRSSEGLWAPLNFLGQGDTIDLGWHMLSAPQLPFNSQVRIPSLDLGSGSALRIFGGGPLKVHGVPSVPTLATNADQELSTLSEGCESVTVQARAGSSVLIGRNNNYFGYERSCVRFTSGSRLVLWPGSRLVLRNHFRLWMDTLSVLEVYPGATVELQGDSSVVHLMGQVILHPGATLNPLGAGQVWVHAGHPMARWSFGRQASLHLRGRSPNHLRLRIAGSWVLGSTRDSVVLEQCRVLMDSASSLECYGPMSARQIKLGGGAGTSMGGAWTLQPSAVGMLDEIQVENMQTGLRLYLLGVQRLIRLSRMQFRGNLVGLETHSSGVELMQCRFEYNRVGWRGYDITGLSTALQCVWVGHTSGVDVMGQAGARLRLQECSLDSNRTGMFSFGQLRVEPLCVGFVANATAWYAGNTQVWLGAQSLNRFNHNQTALYLEEVDLLHLRDGGNSFVGSGRYLDGMLSGLAIQYLIPQPGGTYGLEVQGNGMPLVGGILPSDLRDWDGNPLAYLGAGRQSNPITCQIRMATGGGPAYVREARLASLGRAFEDSLQALYQALFEVGQAGAGPWPGMSAQTGPSTFPYAAWSAQNSGWQARRRSMVQTWASTCSVMEQASTNQSLPLLITQFWAQLSAELWAWCCQSGGALEPWVESGQQRWLRWLDTREGGMFRNDAEAGIWRAQLGLVPASTLSEFSDAGLVEETDGSVLQAQKPCGDVWLRRAGYWNCALNRDPYTASPCRWGPESLCPGLRASAGLRSATNPTATAAGVLSGRIAVGPQPLQVGSQLFWKEPESASPAASKVLHLEWYALSDPTSRSPLRCQTLQPGHNPGPDLPPGTYLVAAAGDDRHRRWFRWVVLP